VTVLILDEVAESRDERWVVLAAARDRRPVGSVLGVLGHEDSMRERHEAAAIVSTSPVSLSGWEAASGSCAHTRGLSGSRRRRHSTPEWTVVDRNVPIDRARNGHEPCPC